MPIFIKIIKLCDSVLFTNTWINLSLKDVKTKKEENGAKAPSFKKKKWLLIL